jgi:hypothetical protein
MSFQDLLLLCLLTVAMALCAVAAKLKRLIDDQEERIDAIEKQFPRDDNSNERKDVNTR